MHESNAAVSRLNNRQCECLTLVAQLKSTKEIAAELGIQPGTVDSYIKEAIALLGARDRRDAARMVQQATLQPPPCELGGEKLGLDPECGVWPGEDTRIDQAIAPTGSMPLADSASRPLAAPGWHGLSWTIARPVDLSRRQRLGLVLKIIIALSLGYGGAVVFVAGTQDILTPYL